MADCEGVGSLWCISRVVKIIVHYGCKCPANSDTL